MGGGDHACGHVEEVGCWVGRGEEVMDEAWRIYGRVGVRRDSVSWSFSFAE